MTTPDLTPRLEICRPRLLAGIRRVHALADMQRAIPQQWQAFKALTPLPSQVGADTYGVMCRFDAANELCEYMTATEVLRFETLVPGTGKLRLPKQKCAVFTHRGHVSDIHLTWDAIWRVWLPASGHTPAQTPDFEFYGPRFNAASGEGEIDIWFPVQDND